MTTAGTKTLCQTNWMYTGVAYDATSTRHNCHCDSICRCSVITGGRVTTIDIDAIAAELAAGHTSGTKTLPAQDRKLLTYAIGRVLSANRIWETHNWDIRIGRGYYGEEVTGVLYTGDGDIDRTISRLLTTTSTADWIKIALEAEYGYVLDELRNATFDVQKLSLADIHIAHRGKRDMRDTKPTDICGLVTADGGRWRLVDGHHRIANVGGSGSKTGTFITATPAANSSATTSKQWAKDRDAAISALYNLNPRPKGATRLDSTQRELLTAIIDQL